jgi:hypothetical protein
MKNKEEKGKKKKENPTSKPSKPVADEWSFKSSPDPPSPNFLFPMGICSPAEGRIRFLSQLSAPAISLGPTLGPWGGGSRNQFDPQTAGVMRTGKEKKKPRGR